MSSDIEKKLDEILVSIRSLESRVTRLESHGTASLVPQGLQVATKKLSIREFLKEKAPADGVQKTLAVAFYIEHYDAISPFNKVDLEKGFRAAKEPVPANVNDKVGMCVKNGHMMEADSKKSSMKAWVLTGTGEELVQANFGKK